MWKCTQQQRNSQQYNDVTGQIGHRNEYKIPI